MVYFISGHRDIHEKVFNEVYVEKIKKVISSDPDPWFLVGDYEGVDYLAQKYLESIGMGPKVKVYHMFGSPRYYVEGLKCVGGFESDEDRDSAMTRDSDFDIAFYSQRKKWSGTFTNIARRWGILATLLILLGCGEYHMSQTYETEVIYFEDGTWKDTCFIVYPPRDYNRVEVIERPDGTIQVSYCNSNSDCSYRLNDGPIIGKGTLLKYKTMRRSIEDLPDEENWWRKTYPRKPYR